MKTEREYIDGLRERLADGAADRLRNLYEGMRRDFFGYDEIIRQVMIASIAGQPFVLIGEPGYAKTQLMKTFFERMGLASADRMDGEARVSTNKYFHYLLHSFTMPDEILGVVDIKTFLKDSLFVRERLGAITHETVRAAFLDEVFSANSAILNTLLSIINEREFYEGGLARRSRLLIVCGASNRVPSEPELLAFFDRFPVRLYLSVDLEARAPGEKDYPLLKILDHGMRHQRRKLLDLNGVERGGEAAVLGEQASIDDFDALNQYLQYCYPSGMGGADASVFPEETREAFYDLVQRLSMSGYCGRLSPRLCVKLLTLAAASAILRSALEGGSLDAPPPIETRDLEVFKNIWQRADKDFIETHQRQVDQILERDGSGR
jgi:MoxR-like ATPase